MKQKRKRWSRWLKLLLILIFAGILTAGGINWFMIHQSKKDIETARQLALEQKGKKADAVVVLGAKVRKDGSMCLMLKERVDLGIQAYKQ